MYRKIMIFVFIILFINSYSFGQKNMIKIIVWDTMNVWKKADPERGKMGSYEETKFIFLGHDFVKNCSLEIKTIITYYLKYIPYYITTEEELEFAKAFGNFSSLHEVQQILLQNKEHYFTEIKRSENIMIRYLVITIEGNKIFFNLGGSEEDEYFLKQNGDIIFIKTKKLR